MQIFSVGRDFFTRTEEFYQVGKCFARILQQQSKRPEHRYANNL